jgi:hypothetical protein
MSSKSVKADQRRIARDKSCQLGTEAYRVWDQLLDSTTQRKEKTAMRRLVPAVETWARFIWANLEPPDIQSNMNKITELVNLVVDHCEETDMKAPWERVIGKPSTPPDKSMDVTGPPQSGESSGFEITYELTEKEEAYRRCLGVGSAVDAADGPEDRLLAQRGTVDDNPLGNEELGVSMSVDVEKGREDIILEHGVPVDDTPIGTEYLEEWEQEEEEQTRRFSEDQDSLLKESEALGCTVWEAWEDLLLRDPNILGKDFRKNYMEIVQSATSWHLWVAGNLRGPWRRRGLEYVADFDNEILRQWRRPDMAHLPHPPHKEWLVDNYVYICTLLDTPCQGNEQAIRDLVQKIGNPAVQCSGGGAVIRDLRAG